MKVSAAHQRGRLFWELRRGLASLPGVSLMSLECLRDVSTALVPVSCGWDPASGEVGHPHRWFPHCVVGTEVRQGTFLLLNYKNLNYFKNNFIHYNLKLTYGVVLISAEVIQLHLSFSVQSFSYSLLLWFITGC